MNPVSFRKIIALKVLGVSLLFLFFVWFLFGFFIYCAAVSSWSRWSWRSLFCYVELASIITESSHNSRSCGRNTVYWLTNGIDPHPLLEIKN
jgi:hypothetical protein